jgi:oxygen-independent coproporphyrinogen-3 oxidase
MPQGKRLWVQFEGHPNNTTHEHLQKLYDLGLEEWVSVFRIILKVQKPIHREQPFHNVAKLLLG